MVERISDVSKFNNLSLIAALKHAIRLLRPKRRGPC